MMNTNRLITDGIFIDILIFCIMIAIKNNNDCPFQSKHFVHLLALERNIQIQPFDLLGYLHRTYGTLIHSREYNVNEFYLKSIEEYYLQLIDYNTHIDSVLYH